MLVCNAFVSLFSILLILPSGAKLLFAFAVTAPNYDEIVAAIVPA
jgi:hypothetical protein